MDGELSLFAGAAGRVLRGAVSVRSLITGLVLGFVLLVGDGVLIYAGASGFVTPFTQIVIALALARFVLNGQYGEWEGTLFSGVGGSWTAVLMVAGRFLALTTIWLLPLLLFGLRVEQATLGAAMMGKKDLALILLYMMGSALTPPLFLVLAVASSDFGELFSRAHWRELFGGRLVDLLSIYAVYTGGVGMAAVLCVPIVALGFLPGWKFGVFLMGLAGCFLLGMAMNLLGRLCGFFALGDLTPPECERSPRVGVGPASDPGPSPSPAQAPEREPVPVSSVAVPTQPAATQPTAAQPVPAPSAQPAVRPAGGLPALLEASQRIRPIMQRFQQDPKGAIRALEDLNDSFAPHPQVMVALCLCRHRTGAIDDSVELAESVLPVCFERGHVQLAAQIFRELRREVDRISLNREQILTIGDALVKKDDLAGAGAAYSTAIRRDAGETRAVKGLLQVAQAYLNDKSKPDSAMRVYDYLHKHCSDSPLSEFIDSGLEHCRKQLTPVG